MEILIYTSRKIEEKQEVLHTKESRRLWQNNGGDNLKIFHQSVFEKWPLDPFCGAGTTLKVAEELNRDSRGIDLGYQDIQKQRLAGIQKRIL